MSASVTPRNSAAKPGPSGMMSIAEPPSLRRWRDSPSNGGGRQGARRQPCSFPLDVRLADDAAVFVVLLANEFFELGSAGPDRKQALRDQLRFDLGILERSREPAG